VKRTQKYKMKGIYNNKSITQELRRGKDFLKVTSNPLALAKFRVPSTTTAEWFEHVELGGY